MNESMIECAKEELECAFADLKESECNTAQAEEEVVDAVRDLSMNAEVDACDFVSDLADNNWEELENLAEKISSMAKALKNGEREEVEKNNRVKLVAAEFGWDKAHEWADEAEAEVDRQP